MSTCEHILSIVFSNFTLKTRARISTYKYDMTLTLSSQSSSTPSLDFIRAESAKAAKQQPQQAKVRRNQLWNMAKPLIQCALIKQVCCSDTPSPEHTRIMNGAALIGPARTCRPATSEHPFDLCFMLSIPTCWNGRSVLMLPPTAPWSWTR